MKTKQFIGIILSILILLSSSITTFSAMDTEYTETGAYSSSDKFALGIDVSHYQNDASSSKTIDWNSVKADGKDFVIIKLTNHITKDAYFDTNYTGAKEAGLQVGAYIYSTATTILSAKEEAYAAIDAIQGKYFEYPIYLDFETSTQKSLSKSVQNDIIDTFVTILRENGYLPGFYSGRDFYINSLDTAHLLSLNIPLWYARYYDNKYTTLTCDYPMWQYSSSGSVNGINGNVDLNVVYVDYPTQVFNDNLNLWRKNGTKTAHLELQSESYEYTITTANLNVRDNPSTSGTNVLGQVHKDDVITVLEIVYNDSVNWGKISYNGETGYISLSSSYSTRTDINKKYIQVNDYEEEPETEESTEAPTEISHLVDPPYSSSDDIFEKGLDVGTIAKTKVDFNAIKNNGYSFVYIKISSNAAAATHFENDYVAAKAAGLKIGGYVTTTATFTSSSLASREHAYKCLELINGKQFDYPIFYYQDTSSYISNETALNYAKSGAKMFVEILQNNGYSSGVFNNNNVLNVKNIYSEVPGEKALLRYKTESSLSDFTWSTLYPANQKIIEYTSLLTDVNGVNGSAAGMISFYNYPSYMKTNNKNGYANNGKNLQYMNIPTGDSSIDSKNGAVPFNCKICMDSGSLTMRPTAGATSGSNGSIPNSTDVIIDEVAISGTTMWGHTTYNGKSGWINLNYTERTYNIIVDGEPDPTEAPTEVPTEAPTEVPTEEPTVAPTEEPTEPKGPFVEFKDIYPVETGIQFMWNAFDGAEKYAIYVLDNETGTYTKLASKAGLSYIYSDVVAGTTYTFNVRPYVVVDGKTTWLAPLNPTGISYTVPGEVVNIKGNVIDNGLRISWDSYPQAEKYNLYRLGDDGKWAKVGFATANKAMVDTTVELGKTYTYTVRPFKTVEGKTTYLADYSTQTLTYTYEAMEQGTVTASSKGLRVSYPSYEGADRYIIYVKDGDTWVKYSSSSNLAITYYNPVPGTTYTFCVRAYDSVKKQYLTPYDEEGFSYTY